MIGEEETMLEYAERFPIEVDRRQAESCVHERGFECLAEAVEQWAEDFAYKDQAEYEERCGRRGEIPNLRNITPSVAEKFTSLVIRRFTNAEVFYKAMDSIPEPVDDEDEGVDIDDEDAYDVVDFLAEKMEAMLEFETRLAAAMRDAFPEYDHLIDDPDLYA